MNEKEDINKLVMNYQESKCAESLEQLITAFNPYLTKWANVIKCISMNIFDNEVASFISSFKYNNMLELQQMLKQKFSFMTYEDVYDEMLILFIGVVTKYKFDGIVYFPGYLTSVFKYRVFAWVMDHIESIETVHDDIAYYNYSRTEDDNNAKDILSVLSDRESNILCNLYVDCIDRKTIEEMYGISSQNLSNIINGARKKLLEAFNN